MIANECERYVGECKCRGVMQGDLSPRQIEELQLCMHSEKGRYAGRPIEECSFRQIYLRQHPRERESKLAAV